MQHIAACEPGHKASAYLDSINAECSILMPCTASGTTVASLPSAPRNTCRESWLGRRIRILTDALCDESNVQVRPVQPMDIISKWSHYGSGFAAVTIRPDEMQVSLAQPPVLASHLAVAPVNRRLRAHVPTDLLCVHLAGYQVPYARHEPERSEF